MLRCFILVAITVLLSACAKPPHLELDAADYMVGRAYTKKAAEFAPAEYQAARTALADAHKAMGEKKYSEAQGSITFALEHARRAVILTEENKARLAEEETARRAEAKEKARLADEKARAVIEARLAQKPEPAPQQVTKPKQKPKITLLADYIVGEGETLWTISAQPEVYHEGLLWPLLYQANRDQIKDPRQIFPGQTLSIRRDMTIQELEEARQKARESDIFPISEAATSTQ